jgi:hypothetical protein
MDYAKLHRSRCGGYANKKTLNANGLMNVLHLQGMGYRQTPTLWATQCWDLASRVDCPRLEAEGLRLTKTLLVLVHNPGLYEDLLLEVSIARTSIRIWMNLAWLAVRPRTRLSKVPSEQKRERDDESGNNWLQHLAVELCSCKILLFVNNFKRLWTASVV